MSYGYSSAYPRVPNSTPQLPTSARPPIHNPYDKFTQPQFDDWIGGITGALRRALGQEEDEIPTSQATQPREEEAHPASDIDEDDVEDSFADWRATRAREKGKMRATEDEQESEYGGSQRSYEGSDVQDHAAGDTPADAIELLSDEDDAEGEEVGVPGGCGDEDNDGALIEDFTPGESDGEARQPYVGISQAPRPSKADGFSVNVTSQEAIEISDGEMEDHNQGDELCDAEDTLFGWEQEEERQPPDIRDPWELPKTYAEDLYTGGPIREADRLKLSPSHLTPAAEAVGYFDNIDPQLRPPSGPVSQPADRYLAEVPQGSVTPVLNPPTIDEVSKADDESSLYDEDLLEPDTPTTADLREEPGFISFTALNQPSDVESEQGGPEILYISDNDGGEVSEDGNEAEEDEFDDGSPIPLGTSDLEIPAEYEIDEDGGEELDELEDDEEPSVEVTANPHYGYYGLDASSVAGSGGLGDETGNIGSPSDPPEGGQGEVPGVPVSQESTSLPDPHNLASLPAAATFINIDHQLQSAAPLVVNTTGMAVAGGSLDGIPTISAEVTTGDGDMDDADEGSAGDVTILADEGVLTVNEVEEVLRGAFAEADQLASITDAQEDAAPVPNTAPSVEGEIVSTPRKPDPTGTTPQDFAGDGALPGEPAIKVDGYSPVEPSASTVMDKPSDSTEPQKGPLPFIMPLIANPNVRDPMSAPWSPVQSGPSTPIAGQSYLPAVAKFKRDNQLLGTAHTSSGLFTPLEGSGSSSPSPSDITTPEDRASAGVDTEVSVVEDDERPKDEQASPVSGSPIAGSPEIPEVEPEDVLAGPPEDDDWGEIPRLPTPPAEIVDRVEESFPTDSATRVFTQPEEPYGGIVVLDTPTEAHRTYVTNVDNTLLVVVADTPHEGNEDAPGLDDVKPLLCQTNGATKDLPEVTETDDPFKLLGNDSAIAPGAVASDSDESSIASSFLDEDETPETRPEVSETPASLADLQTVEPMNPGIQPLSKSLGQVQETVAAPTEARRSSRKRKHSKSIAVDPEPPGPAAGGEVFDTATTSIGAGEHTEAGRKLPDDQSQNNGEEHDSDSESFVSSLVAPRNASASSQDGSRASSVVSEQPHLLQDQTPGPEDAPVFHGHGKFKAALQALKLFRQSSVKNSAEEPEREKERAKEKKQETMRPVAPKMGSRKPSGNGSKDNAEAKKPPSLVLPEVSVQPSLPSASTSQSPRTPTSTLPPPSPTVVAVPAEVTPSPHQEKAALEPAGPGREEAQKPAAKAAKRTPSRRYVPVPIEPKSTRSQCRYRKISLPRDEDGPRVTFCVPQCSLNDKELMEEEEITDDGLATVRDFERLWDHVEEQNLNPYLIGVIRQLVGLDLLRENEIYYLPTDEEIKQTERKQKREERRKSRKSIGGATNWEGTSVAGPVFLPSASQTEKKKLPPPPSFAGSISTTASTRSKVGRGGSARSISEDEMSDGERDGRALKRRKRAGKERDGDGSSQRNTPSFREDSAAPGTAGSPGLSQSTAEPTPVRRSQRTLKKAISVDTQAYNPPVSSGGESSEDELESPKARRKSTRGGTRGLKRRRTDGAADPLTPTTEGAGDRDARLSPRSTRSKRVKTDEK